MKVVCGLGNPGPEYQATRHNVGWWLLDALQQAGQFERFRRAGNVMATAGRVDDEPVRLLKPLTYMNRSGAALIPLLQDPEFNVAEHLLIVVDDAALPIGRARIRANGSAGGHNGLKSVEATLATQDYPRLRIGVDSPPPEIDLADWVLSPFPTEDEARVRELIPKLVDVVRVWAREGVTAASQHLNS